MHEADVTRVPDAQAEWLVWLDPEGSHGRCLACGFSGSLTTRVSVRNPFSHKPIVYAQCPQCGSLTGLDFQAPEYRDEGDAAYALKFAKEQGAGITTMIAPLYWVDRSDVERFLDVGGGYGFALDAARRLFDWRVHGADPSYFARVGARELGLTIEDRYVSETSPAEGGPYDLVLASEVIEHVDDPVEFARVLRACATPQGRVILTTPCAEDALNHEDEARALMALAPGSHAAVFSETGLETVLKAAGFNFVTITRRESGLVAAAGPSEFRFDPSVEVPAADFETYLEAAIDAVEAGSDLQIGLLMRLCRQHANAARWGSARESLTRLSELLSARYGVDLLAPEGFQPDTPESFVEYAKLYPFCLGPAFFVLGLMRLIDEGDRPGALHAFEAAYQAAHRARQALISIGADDIDLAIHERRARIHKAQVLAWIDVDEAAALLGEEWALAETKSDEHAEALAQICDVAARMRSRAIDAVFDLAEAFVRPVTLGARESSHRDGIILLALAQRFEWMGNPVGAEHFACAARTHAHREDTYLAAHKLLEAVRPSASARLTARDRRTVVQAMAAGRPGEADAACLRIIARGPDLQDLEMSDRLAVALWCLGPADRPEHAVCFLRRLDPDEIADSETCRELLALAQNTLSDPAYIHGRMSAMGARGDWMGFQGLLGAIQRPDPGAMPPEAAFALAMFQLNKGGDLTMAIDAFQQAAGSTDAAVVSAARFHRVLSLHRAGKTNQALEGVTALGEELAAAPSGPLASQQDNIKTLAQTLSAQGQNA